MENRMNTQEVLLTARFKAKAGKEDEVESILKSLIEPTRNEEGCVFYHLHRVKDDKGHFLFYECFANQEAFEIHAAKPYIRAFLDKVDEYCSEPADIKFLEKIE
jgi:quinol monooxygenase YgiN